MELKSSSAFDSMSIFDGIVRNGDVNEKLFGCEMTEGPFYRWAFGELKDKSWANFVYSRLLFIFWDYVVLVRLPTDWLPELRVIFCSLESPKAYVIFSFCLGFGL